jgi:hypothetical protein
MNLASVARHIDNIREIYHQFDAEFAALGRRDFNTARLLVDRVGVEFLCFAARKCARPIPIGGKRTIQNASDAVIFDASKRIADEDLQFALATVGDNRRRALGRTPI